VVAGLVAGTVAASTAFSSGAEVPVMARARLASSAGSPALEIAEDALASTQAAAGVSAGGATVVGTTLPPSRLRVNVSATGRAGSAATPASARPSPAVVERDLARNSSRAASRSSARTGLFVRPAKGAITGTYGERRRHERHPGLDIDGNTGDPVLAAAAGTVIAAGPAPSGYAGYGKIVLIDHGGGITTLYAHLSKVAVGVGSTVDAGDYIGAIGTTGHVTGSHLHFEVRVNGDTVNPADWID